MRSTQELECLVWTRNAGGIFQPFHSSLIRLKIKGVTGRRGLTKWLPAFVCDCFVPVNTSHRCRRDDSWESDNLSVSWRHRTVANYVLIVSGVDLGGGCVGCCSTPLNPSVRINGNYSECAYNVEETIADSWLVAITFAMTTLWVWWSWF